MSSSASRTRNVFADDMTHVVFSALLERAGGSRRTNAPVGAKDHVPAAHQYGDRDKSGSASIPRRSISRPRRLPFRQRPAERTRSAWSSSVPELVQRLPATRRRIRCSRGPLALQPRLCPRRAARATRPLRAWRSNGLDVRADFEAMRRRGTQRETAHRCRSISVTDGGKMTDGILQFRDDLMGSTAADDVVGGTRERLKWRHRPPAFRTTGQCLQQSLEINRFRQPAVRANRGSRAAGAVITTTGSGGSDPC